MARGAPDARLASPRPMSTPDDAEHEAAARAEIARLQVEVHELFEALDGERALRRALIDHAPDLIVMCDLDGRITFVNRFLPGFDDARVIGRPLTDFVPEAYHQRIRTCLDNVVRNAVRDGFESLAPGANDVPTHFFTRVTPVLEGGKVTALVCSVIDIEQLRRTEAALRHREAELDVVLEATGMGIWWTDLESGAGEADPRCRQILGVPEGPLSAEAVMAVIAPEDRPRVAAALEAAATSGTYSLEHGVVRPSGEVRWARAAARVRMEGGRPRLIGGVLDITRHRRLEQQVAQSQKLDSIGRLAGGVAHDFNNLLTAILGSVEIASLELPAGSAALAELTHIRRAAERGATLTAQLLAFARRQMIEPRVVSPDALVVDVDRLLQRILGEDVELVTIRQASGRVKVDPHQIERVLINLATNARDAMPRGGRMTIETLDVVLDETRFGSYAEIAPGAYVVLAVSDTGVGIPPEAMPHLFEPFFTTKGLERGTGLGLATCYGIVRQAGGHIQVYSELGRGTTFRIYLPRVESADEQSTPAAPTPGARSHETALLVEDDPGVRRATSRMLKHYGYRVLEAADGLEALALAGSFSEVIDILITDVVMPGLGGRQLADRLLVMRPGLAVLYVSGFTDNAIVHHGVLERGVAFLQKPFTPAMLQARIRQILDARADGDAGADRRRD
ncbi:MAG: PAS domain S-box protein [Deltaproteobacteria bacterium]|nr:PAS domain S-box protein [Deltaproteobacteria bacterium]